MTDLLDAIDALTKPTRTKVIQGDTVTTITHDALLVQLETAITSAIGNGGGGGTATGSVINDAALHQLTTIKSQLGDWCHVAGVAPDRDVVARLRKWHVAVLGRNVDTTWHVTTLRGWAKTIQELLDPPKTVPLAGPCPVCAATNWVGPDDTLRASPVAVLYDQTTLHASLRAVCRVVSCGAEWVGADAVQELVEEMTEREEAS